MPELNESVIACVANAYSVGASKEDIHDMLAKDGFSEADIFLVYCAGKLLVDQESS